MGLKIYKENIFHTLYSLHEKKTYYWASQSFRSSHRNGATRAGGVQAV